MSKNKLVYSTNPDYSLEENEEQNDLNKETSSQKLRIRLETKHRAGKKATIIHGFEGSDNELESLAKQLKTKLGVGGSVKDGEIIIQGDYAQKTKDLLIQLGYKNTK
jgi:translation initiation factor 1